MYTGFRRSREASGDRAGAPSFFSRSLRNEGGDFDFLAHRNNWRTSAKINPMPPKPQGHDTRYVKMQKNNCFVCGMNNPDGMRLKFVLDEASQTFVCRFRLGKRYTGPPGHCHGGIIASILDDAMGKVNKLHHVIALTREMTVEYLKPVPLHEPLRVEGREVKVEGRTHINAAEILNEKDEVLARSRGTFIAIDPEKMFAKYVASK